jgi:cholesterol transport system auxiliary component
MQAGAPVAFPPALRRQLLHTPCWPGLALGLRCSVIDKPVSARCTTSAPGRWPPRPGAPPTTCRVGAGRHRIVGAPLDSTAVLYRLAYSNANQLLPYSQARWSGTPPQLVRQRLRELLGRERVVLNLGESASLARDSASQPRVLRIELEEFSHVFESPATSFGLLRLRATLLESTAAGEKVLSQRTIIERQPAATPDAPGGVRALAAATDAAAADISQWLQQTR